MRIVLTGGGTGGHLIPFEPIVEALRTVYLEQKDTLPKNTDPARCDLYFLGIASQSTTQFFKRYDVAVTHIPSGKLRRYFSLATPFDLLIRLPLGILKSLMVMWFIMPDVVISKGGFASLPTTLAAAFYRIPILLHESDAAAGLANRLNAHLASAIAVGLPAAADSLKNHRRKVTVVGIPIRARFGTTPPATARQAFNLNAGDRVLLVMGGSQGAQQINEVLLKVLPQLIADFAIIHLTGPAHYQSVSTVAQELIAASAHHDRYQAYPELTDTIDAAFAAADAVVTRSGATTLAELARCKKPALLIPLAHAANDHQRQNAAIFEAAGAARVLDPTNLGANLFEHNVRELMTNKTLRQQLTTNIARFDRPRAARDLAELALKLAQDLVPVFG